MISFLLWIGLAHAVDVNDTVRLTLDGGESIDGWFVHYEPETLSIHVPKLSETVQVPFSIVNHVEVNRDPLALDSWKSELSAWHRAWLQGLSEQPFAPPVWSVALTSTALAGTGHALLGDWQQATGMLIADSLGMSVAAWEITHGQRLNVVVGGVAVSAVMKMYAISNGIRLARRKRAKMKP